MLDHDVKIKIQKKNDWIDLSLFEAEFFGYDCEFGSVNSRSYPTHYGMTNQYIKADYEPYRLTVTYLVKTLEKMVSLARCLDRVDYSFSDSLFLYHATISNYEYEVVNANTYQIQIVYDADIYSDHIKYTISQLETDLFIDSPMPTFIYLYLKVQESTDNYTLLLEYYDPFYLRKINSHIRLQHLNKGDILVIDSKEFKIWKNDQLQLKDIEIDLFPIMNGNLKIHLPNEKVSVRIEYERRY